MRTQDPLTPLWRTVKLVIGFQGTHYEGWQSQKKEKTVQEVLEKTLSMILKDKTVVHGSSRTDSGVHALGLVAHFKTSNPLHDKKIQQALNFHLPKDIVIFSAKTAPDTFHARFSAKSKLYRYQIWNSKTRPLLDRDRMLWYPHKLRLNAMKQAAKHLIGKHDFSAFRDLGDERKSYVRHIKRLHLSKKGPLITLDVEGDGFLRHMVRVIVGTLIDAGRGKLSASAVRSALASKDRSKAGPTAKAHGLTLIKVRF